MLTKLNSNYKDGRIPDVMILCNAAGIPRIAPMLWQSLVGTRYSDSYVSLLGCLIAFMGRNKLTENKF